MFMVASLLGWEPLLVGLNPLRNLVGGLVWVGEGEKVFVLIAVCGYCHGVKQYSCSNVTHDETPVTYCDPLGLMEYVHDVEDGTRPVLEPVGCAVSHQPPSTQTYS